MKRVLPFIVIALAIGAAFVLGRFSNLLTGGGGGSHAAASPSATASSAVAASSSTATPPPTQAPTTAVAEASATPAATATIAPATPRATSAVAAATKAAPTPKAKRTTVAKITNTSTNSSTKTVTTGAVEDLPVVETPHLPVAVLDFPAGGKIARVKQLEDGTGVRVEFTGTVPRHQVFRAQKPRRIYIDFDETEVPGGAELGPRPGAPPLKELSVKPLSNADGAVARVVVLLEDSETPQPKTSESVDGNALIIRW